MVVLSKIDTVYQFCLQTLWNILAREGSLIATEASLDAKGTPFKGELYEKKILLLCRYSSVVEHTLGKGGVASPILASGTIKKATFMVVFLMVTLVKDGLAGDRQVRTDFAKA